MYLSKLELDALAPAVYETLGAPYRLHQAVMAAFDPTERRDTRVLFRVERGHRRGCVLVLVQSEIAPDWARSGERFFGGRLRAEAKELRPSLREGARFLFRLRANPTERRHFPDLPKGQSKRVGVYGEEKLRAWLERKLTAAGAVYRDGTFVDEGLIQGTDGHRPLKFHSVLYDGVLEVQNGESLLSALGAGIGSAKGFGFGLLSLARE